MRDILLLEFDRHTMPLTPPHLPLHSSWCEVVSSQLSHSLHGRMQVPNGRPQNDGDCDAGGLVHCHSAGVAAQVLN